MAIGIIIAVILTLAAAVPLTWYVTSSNHRKQDAIKVDSAEARARAIIDEALREAESKKREAMLEIREETFKSKNELEKEIQNRRNEVQKNERRIQQKEEQIDNKIEQLERREQNLTAREDCRNFRKKFQCLMSSAYRNSSVFRA